VKKPRTEKKKSQKENLEARRKEDTKSLHISTQKPSIVPFFSQQTTIPKSPLFLK